MRETLDEARHHLSLPIPLLSENKPAKRSKAPTGTRQAARRLWAASKPVADSPVAAYLAFRQIIDLTSCEALRLDRKSTRLNSCHKYAYRMRYYAQKKKKNTH